MKELAEKFIDKECLTDKTNSANRRRSYMDIPFLTFLISFTDNGNKSKRLDLFTFLCYNDMILIGNLKEVSLWR